jgi:serine/threonine-protein kinase
LVHREVKPSDILVAEDDFAYLIDFGGEAALTKHGRAAGPLPSYVRSQAAGGPDRAAARRALTTGCTSDCHASAHSSVP